MESKIKEVCTANISPNLRIVNGIIDNLPDIITSVREIFKIHRKEKALSNILQTKIVEMNVNKDNFSVLVQALTDLSKSPDTDQETKDLYREMIKTMFDMFVNNMKGSNDLSNFLNKF